MSYQWAVGLVVAALLISTSDCRPREEATPSTPLRAKRLLSVAKLDTKRKEQLNKIWTTKVDTLRKKGLINDEDNDKFFLPQEGKKYVYGYSAPDGGPGRMEAYNGKGERIGKYSYTDANGKDVEVHYKAGPSGFHVISNNLPEDSPSVNVAKRQFFKVFNEHKSRKRFRNKKPIGVRNKIVAAKNGRRIGQMKLGRSGGVKDEIEGEEGEMENEEEEEEEENEEEDEDEEEEEDEDEDSDEEDEEDSSSSSSSSESDEDEESDEEDEDEEDEDEEDDEEEEEDEDEEEEDEEEEEGEEDEENEDEDEEDDDEDESEDEESDEEDDSDEDSSSSEESDEEEDSSSSSSSSSEEDDEEDGEGNAIPLKPMTEEDRLLMKFRKSFGQRVLAQHKKSLRSHSVKMASIPKVAVPPTQKPKSVNSPGKYSIFMAMPGRKSRAMKTTTETQDVTTISPETTTILRTPQTLNKKPANSPRLSPRFGRRISPKNMT